MSNRHLTDKVAWVTGSSRGIGRVVVTHLASLGASVVVSGTSHTATRVFDEGESIEAVAREISQEHGVRAISVCGDLSDETVVRQLAGEIRQEFGRIDILVNCAGGDIGAEGITAANGGKPQGNDAINMSLEDIRAVLDRNLMTCILVCREVAPEMMERKSGCIVNIGSVAGLQGHPTEAIYCAAKAGVHIYSRSLAAMMRPYGVRVNVVAPGQIVTPRFVASRPVDESRMSKSGDLGRYGWPIEIARVVAFLVSDDSSFISGQVLRVDGGGQPFPA